MQWRLTDCEEVLKTRVSEERLAAFQRSIKNSQEQEFVKQAIKTKTALEAAVVDLQDNLDTQRKKTNKLFTESREIALSYEPKVKKMLVHEDITGINTDIDALKRRMNEEFEQFQQYLKNEKKSFGELYTKVRHIERQAVDIKTEMLDPGSVEGFAESNTSHSKTSNP